MYSVLIVDDEEPVLDSYSYLVDSGLDEFQVAGTARSGGDAIRVARDTRPDVVLMDIAMPGIDGIDTIRELQHELPDSLYILSTAYERFDLAQRAIPLRVFAYLVKPVSRQRFIETMVRAKGELDEDRRRRDRRLEEAQHGEEELGREIQDFILLLTWKPFDRTGWTRFRRLFRLQSDHGLVVAVDAPTRELYPALARQVERRYRCIWAENMRRMIMFVSDSAAPEQIEHVMRDAAAALAARPGAVTVSVGSRRRFDELYLSCDEALNGIPTTAGSEEHLRQFRSRVREFGRAITRARAAEDVESVYQTLTDEVFATWPFTVAKSRVAAAFERVLHDFDSRVGNGELSLLIADPIHDVMDFETRKELDAWAQRVLRRLVEQQVRYAGSQWPAALKEAVGFMDTHYARPLQLTSVAEHCEVSAGYLSRLFSEHLGSSFNDHLNSVRLDAAQRLLEEGRRTVKEIAYSVGYHDPNYFSRIFKKFKGVSPTSFSQREGIDV